jgi:hypothetical protein
MRHEDSARIFGYYLIFSRMQQARGGSSGISLVESRDPR